MRMRWWLSALVTAVVMGNLTGCAVRQMSSPAGPPLRAAADLPDHFLTSTPIGAVEPRPDEGCRNPLIDPRDETRLTLIRSAEGRGDYEPGPLRYGLHEGELLRVDCASGRAVGIVKR